MISNRVRSGFALIELLVVISIIAMLAAILAPVFSTAKVAAGQSACVNNLRQIQVAMALYMENANNTFPPVVVNSSDPRISQGYLWLLHSAEPCILSPYLKGKPPVCPDDLLSKALAKTLNFGDYWEGYASYGYNCYYLANCDVDGYPMNDAPPMNKAQLAKPSRTIEFTDKNTSWTCAVCPPYVDLQNGPQTVKTTIGYWHGGGKWLGAGVPMTTGIANILWVDGHVSTTTPGSAISKDPRYWGSNYQYAVPQYDGVYYYQKMRV